MSDEIDHSEDERRPLSRAEITELRHLLEREQRMGWLWSTIRIWAAWIGAVVVGLTVGLDALKRIAKSLVQ